MTAINVKGLTKRFGDVLAVDRSTSRSTPGRSFSASWPPRPGRPGPDRARVQHPQPEALRDLLVTRGASVTLDGPGRLVVGGATAEQVGPGGRRRGVVLHEMRFARSSLEDVFLELTGKEGRHAARLIRAELLKLRTTRTLLAVAALVLGILSA